MANLDFYATVGDHEALLVGLLQYGDVRIFESYSELDSDLREFTEVDQILDELRQARAPRLAVLLQIWAPAASAKIEIERFSVTAISAAQKTALLQARPHASILVRRLIGTGRCFDEYLVAFNILSKCGFP